MIDLRKFKSLKELAYENLVLIVYASREGSGETAQCAVSSEPSLLIHKVGTKIKTLVKI